MVGILFALGLSARIPHSITSIVPIPGRPGEKVAKLLAMHISNTGYVALTAILPDNAGSRAELWSKGKGTVAVPVPTGGSFALVDAVNDKGEIAGSYQTAKGSRMLLWSKEKGLTKLPDLGYQSMANGINNTGLVVGMNQHTPKDFQQAIKFQNGKLTVLKPGEAYEGSAAVAVNDSGQIAGTSFGDPLKQTLATLWQADGTPTQLPLFTNCNASVATAINDRGEVVGYCYSQTNQGAGFLYGPNGMVPIPRLGLACSPAAINHVAQVVGTASLNATLKAAFLYEAGYVQDLNEMLPPKSGWVLLSATGINDKQQIVGNGLFNGQPRPFLIQLK